MITLYISKIESESVIAEYGTNIFQLYEFDLSAFFLQQKHNSRHRYHVHLYVHFHGFVWGISVKDSKI